MTSRVLGDYKLLKQIGQGSLGTVFLAEHRFMKKQYALKILPEELAQDKTFVQRFEEEVTRVAALDHPNIVKVHNISYVEGCYFLVMDCVVDPLGETTNLSQFMAEQSHPLLEEDLIRWLYQLAKALDYAHFKPSGQSIVHRGLKLNNILIGRGELDRVNFHIADFGLSRIIGTGAVLSRIYKSVAKSLDLVPFIQNEASGQDQFASTASFESDKVQKLHASFLQSYSFLAPEQKYPTDYPEVGLKCDVYAFGVLTYYLITKKFPEGVFDMPSYIMPQFQKNWDALITKCLQTDPTKRPESMVGVLDEVLSDTPTSLKAAIEKVEVTKKSGLHEGHKPLIASTEESSQDAEAVLQSKVSSESLPSKVSSIARSTVAESASIQSTSSEPATEIKKLKPIIQEGEIKRPYYDPDPGAIFNLETTVTHYQPKKMETVKDIQPILTEMIVVKEGTFIRGSRDGNRDEMPQHHIHLKSFAIDVHPITNEQFVRFLDAMGGEKDAQNNDIIRLKESRIKRSGGQLSIESGYSKHPVVGISWYGAVAYAKWTGKRLPTEAEWEITAKAREETLRYPTGEEIEKHHANFFSSDTTAVMSYPPNALGVYDMAGNVYEWCQDWYGYNYYDVSAQEPDQPKGPLQGVYRVLRGGCWKSLREDLRCSHRHRNNPGCENRTYGFRCATDVQ
ncbi:MAG: Serine/threonine-protein kinase Pkn1 [Chlamydiae bacterium]|nr:Serine/threonine-protein kinase Pkn1 [Chlamydiota bacterium]